MKAHSRIHITVRGTVQGVFFRHSTKALAEKLGLTGYASNLVDGSVDIVAEGAKEKLNELFRWAERGPEHATVLQCETKWEEATGEFSTFSIQ